MLRIAIGWQIWVHWCHLFVCSSHCFSMIWPFHLHLLKVLQSPWVILSTSHLTYIDLYLSYITSLYFHLCLHTHKFIDVLVHVSLLVTLRAMLNHIFTTFISLVHFRYGTKYRSNMESVMDKSAQPLNRMKVAVNGRQNVFELNNKFNTSIHDRR